MLDTKVFLQAIDELENNGIAREVTIQALKEAFESIIKKKNYEDSIVRVEILPEQGVIQIFNIKKVVGEVNDDNLEIGLEEAREVKSDIQIGDDFEIEVKIDDFTKQDAIKFKSILKQKVKEAEKAAIYGAYIAKKGELITGVVEKCEQRYTLVNIGRTSVILKDNQKIGDERFVLGQSIKVYVDEVSTQSGGPQIIITRANAGFLKRLFEEEVHDIYDGTVVIKEIAREAGERSKISVYTNDINVDPIGACIGQGGTKIQKICSQIGKEKIDVVQYHEHQGLLIAESLKPAVVLGVQLNEAEHSAIAVVKNDDLRVAIGKKGVNARLAVKLTGWKIDIKELDDAMNEGIKYITIEEMKHQEEEMSKERRRAQLLKEQEEEERIRFEKSLEVVDNPILDEEEPLAQEDMSSTEEKVEEVVEEKIEFKPVILQPKVSLADLEKEIEEEKRRAKANPVVKPSFKKSFKKEEEEKVEFKQEFKKDERSFKDIYTEEELAELDDEELDEFLDEDIDYTDYDKYYEE